jgi:sialate O-acetylesterase
VGERLARWASSVSYGVQDLAWRGPRPKNARREGDGILVSFDAERGALATRDGKAPASVIVAGEDGVFRVAQAEIRPPNSMFVRSPDVATPVEVRYAWQDNPADANLLDDASKLPAHPFRIRVEADPVQAVPVK